MTGEANSNFQEQRDAFHTLREALATNLKLRKEIEMAIGALVREYDTAIRENRFIVGGALEHIIGSAMRAAGVSARNRGKTEVGSDILLQEGAGMSVKSTFTDPPGEIRLVNTLGPAAERVWKDATVIVVAGYGIGYFDPDLLPNATKSSGDAVVLPKSAYLELFEGEPDWLAEVTVPSKESVATTKVASYAVAEEILSRDDFDLLRRNRTSVAPG